MDTIAAKLDELSDVRAALDVARQDYETKRFEILRTVQAELDALTVEYQPLFDTSEERITVLTEEIKRQVLDHGASVKGAHLHAVYARGRVTWYTQGLDRYAVEHPEVIRFRKQGQPSVSLRAVDPREHRLGLEE